jgi:hypothetical protein
VRFNIVGDLISSANEQITKRHQFRSFEVTAVARYEAAEGALNALGSPRLPKGGTHPLGVHRVTERPLYATSRCAGRVGVLRGYSSPGSAATLLSMAQPNVPDLRARRRRHGLIAGVSVAILGTVVAYVSLWVDPSGESRWWQVLFWLLWVAPPVLAVLLALLPRTRSLAAGLGLGLAMTWIVSVPTCVGVSLGTVPGLLG